MTANIVKIKVISVFALIDHSIASNKRVVNFRGKKQSPKQVHEANISGSSEKPGPGVYLGG